MERLISIDSKKITPVFQQIKDEIVRLIEERKLTQGSPIPSIHRFCTAHQLSPGTVIRAYEELRLAGIVASKQGKGYYIANTTLVRKLRIFLLFDRMNAYKEILYQSIIEGLGKDVEVNVFFHHYDHKRFEQIIRDNLGKYSHYLIMPHLHEDLSKILKRIPDKELILIDGMVEGYTFEGAAVYQNFRNDIFNGLREGFPLIQKYCCVNLCLSANPFQFIPKGCIDGFMDFIKETGFDGNIIHRLAETGIVRNHFYIVFDDAELIWFLKEIERLGWKVGVDIGVVSYDETPMKELLHGGISVLTTDFQAMGSIAVSMIKGELSGRMANRFELISRGSF